MAMKKTVFVAVLLLVFVFASGTTIAVYAQGTTGALPEWFSWELAITYAVLGALGSLIHDFNDGGGVVILPHKVDQGHWDLGVITPAIFGAIAGFFTLAVPNVPFLQGLFPEMITSAPGAFSAFLAGYLYSKTVQVALSKIHASPITTPAPAPVPAPAPAPTA